MTYTPSFKRYAEASILMEWPQIIDKNILNDILVFNSKIKKIYNENKVRIVHAYNSLLIHYDNCLLDFKEEIENLKRIYNTETKVLKTSSKLWKVPVCYDTKFGIDLDELSVIKQLPKDYIINLHTKAVYTVYFIGFLPGFLYLGGLNERLHIPRKSTPRFKIKKGAVAIGGKQTGVYPNESPGGWHIIGNSPIHFFNVDSKTPCFAKAGDAISFYPVSLKEYHNIKTLVDNDTYQLENEVLHD